MPMMKNDEEVDYDRILDWVNLVTGVHNDMVKGNLFAAGFNLCFLQQSMIDILKILEKKERRHGMYD
jgi:hypothetical protein